MKAKAAERKKASAMSCHTNAVKDIRKVHVLESSPPNTITPFLPFISAILPAGSWNKMLASPDARKKMDTATVVSS